MRVYVEGEAILIDVSESSDEESLDVFIVDHGIRQRIESRLMISPKRSVKLKVGRRVREVPVVF